MRAEDSGRRFHIGLNIGYSEYAADGGADGIRQKHPADFRAYTGD